LKRNNTEGGVMSNNIIDDYVSNTLEQLLTLYKGEYSREELESIVRKKAEEDFKDPKVTLINNYGSIKKDEINLSSLVEKLKTSKPILTGSGLLLKQQNIMQGMFGLFADKMMEDRRINKEKLFQHINDPVLSVIYESAQLVDKLLGNSTYGVMGANGSLFKNIFTAEAITGTGFLIITTTVNGFERFFGNLYFTSMNTLIKYLARVVNLDLSDRIKEICESYDIEYTNNEVILDYLIGDDKDLTVWQQRVFDFFMSNVKFDILESEIKTLKKFIEKLSLYELVLLYYRNDFYEFIKTPIIQPLIEYLHDKDLMKIGEFLKENDLEHKDILEALWFFLDTFVADYTVESEQLDKVPDMQRRTVLVIDTDSNFLYLGPFLKYIEETFGLVDLSLESKVSIVNILTFCLSKYVEKLFYTLTSKLNIQEEFKKYIVMKNEFMFEKLLLTKLKKNYLAKSIFREGNFLKEPKIVIKGLQFKKSGTNRATRDFFNDLIMDEIIYPDNINFESLINKILDFQDLICKELADGSPNYASNERLNNFGNYKFPYRMAVVRGSILWNALYPQNPILPGDRAYVYKTNLITVEDLASIKDEYPEEFDIIYKTVFMNEELTSYGVGSFVFPRNVSKLPDFIIPFIRVEEIITDNLKKGFPIVEALGIKIFTTGGTDSGNAFISNIIDM